VFNPPPPLKRTCPFIFFLINLNSLYKCKNSLYLVWLKLVRCFILRILSNTHMLFSLSWSLPTPGDHNLYQLEYVLCQEASCKCELFWHSGSRGEHFSMTSPYFCIFVIIYHLTRTWPVFGQFLILLIQGWFVWSLIEIGVLVLEKKIIFNVNTYNYGFSYCVPSRPPGTMIYIM
jgi:hypothetical protein